jgi:ribonucleotide reductase alpha subunit
MTTERMNEREKQWWSRCFCYMAQRHLAKAQRIKTFDIDQLARLKDMVNSSSMLVASYAEEHPNNDDLQLQAEIISAYRAQINQL